MSTAGPTSLPLSTPKKTPPGTIPSHPRNFTLAHRLLKLPTELVHQVFSDLTLARILELLCAVDPDCQTITYLDECLATHLGWFKLLFPAPPHPDTPPPYHGFYIDPETGLRVRHGTIPVSVMAYEYGPDGGPNVWHIKRSTLPASAEPDQVEYHERQVAAAEHARFEYIQQLKKHFKLYLDIALLAHPHAVNQLLDNLGLGEAAPPGLMWNQMTWGFRILKTIKNTLLSALLTPKVDVYLPVYRQFTLAALSDPASPWAAVVPPEPAAAPEFPLPQANDTWDYYHLREQWDTLRAAERRVVALKTTQLRRIIALIAAHPRTLRFGINASQDRLVADRLEAHLLARLRRDLGCVEGKAVVRETWQQMAGHVFKRAVFPLVPYDVFLRGFCRVLGRFPVPEESADGTTSADDSGVYPPEIARKIREVLRGMASYTVHPPLKRGGGSKYLVKEEEIPAPRVYPRTMYTAYSDPPKRTIPGRGQPRFLGCETEESQKGVCVSKLPLVNRLLPLVEGEFLWLEGFLEVCGFMAGMETPWGTARWKKGKGRGKKGEKREGKEAGEAEEGEGLTVKEWWAKRVLEV